LDNKRLGKQRVEAYQILRTLLGHSKGWINHPAVKMWKGYERSLADYGLTVCDEWKQRGFKDTLRGKFNHYLDQDEYPEPEWLGDKQLHASHRSNLLRKDPKHYGQFGWKEPDDLPYFWPTKEGY